MSGCKCFQIKEEISDEPWGKMLVTIIAEGEKVCCLKGHK